jgi:hypothetical protein
LSSEGKGRQMFSLFKTGISSISLYQVVINVRFTVKISTIFFLGHAGCGSVLTITICPGPLVHSMGKMTWRNDNGEDYLIWASPVLKLHVYHLFLVKILHFSRN